MAVICNQENFLLHGNSYILNKVFPKFHIVVKPAVKVSIDGGRPRNGMFIAVPDKLKNNISDVSPGHWRIQAVLLNINESRTLIINVYFPVDKFLNKLGDGHTDELDETLSIIDKIIEDTNCDKLIIAILNWTKS